MVQSAWQLEGRALRGDSTRGMHRRHGWHGRYSMENRHSMHGRQRSAVQHTLLFSLSHQEEMPCRHWQPEANAQARTSQPGSQRQRALMGEIIHSMYGMQVRNFLEDRHSSMPSTYGVQCSPATADLGLASPALHLFSRKSASMKWV